MQSLFDTFSTHAKRALKTAFGLALSAGQTQVGPEHVLYGISQQRGSIGAELLTKANLDSTKLKAVIARPTGKIITRVTEIDLSTAGKRLLEKAMLLANTYKHSYVGTEHLVAAALAINDQKINAVFTSQEINIEALKQQVTNILQSASKFPNISNALGAFPAGEDEELFLGAEAGVATKQPNSLENFATHLTDQTVQQSIDPVIGRDEEITRLIQILSRRQKNNPILLGEPGVGKTAIVEGLAKKILLGQVPEVLLNKKIYALDLGLVVAGTSFRGEFEHRLKQIIAEVKKDPNIILFIDEIHNLAGAGSATGSMDAANLLKPALARGDLRCIGATTYEEYKKHIASDSALERRFQPVLISQPSPAKTVEILRGIKKYYEDFHKVAITDDALVAAAELSHRYIPDRFLPDKAIDLIDEAASQRKIVRGTPKVLQQIITLEQELSTIKTQKRETLIHEHFTLAVDFRNKERELSDEIEKLQRKHTNANRHYSGVITKENIYALVAKVTGIPVAEIASDQSRQLVALEKKLGKHIIGQTEAIEAVASAIRRSRAGVTNERRPIGSFMFLGPSGVGKTELAKTIATEVFGQPEALLRIDMAEFSENFTVSRLLGAPAGYVGYKEGATLTDFVKRRPYCVILFDEIEKAHPQIFNVLLSILDDGRVTDATGKQVDFSNTIIVLTSNIGSAEFTRQAKLGFSDTQKQADVHESTKEAVLKQLKDSFRPEFLNRLDHIIIFKPLTLAVMTQIANLELKKLQKRLEKNSHLSLTYTPSVARHIALKSFSPETGAREIRKMIYQQVEDPIASKILQRRPKKISITTKNKALILR